MSSCRTIEDFKMLHLPNPSHRAKTKIRRINWTELFTSFTWAIAFAFIVLSFAHAQEQVIYAIKDDGRLLYDKYTGVNTGTFSWGTANAQIGTGWNLPHVFSGGDGVIFAINEQNELLYYKYLGLKTGAFSWGNNAGIKIGTGWQFTHVFSGGDGVIFAINDKNELLYYKYLGLSTGAVSWGKTGVKIGTGWDFTHVFSGGDGVIFAINDKNELFYYKYLGMATGDKLWGRTGVQIGTGWKFVHVSSGGDGVIYAVNDRYELFYFKYLGMKTGDYSWGKVNMKIGTGWDLKYMFAEGTRGGQGDLVPHPDQLPPDRDPRCSQYASEAVRQFNATLASPKCGVVSSGAWQPNFENHYKWCLTVPRATAGGQENFRNEHLYACGAKSRPSTY